MKKDQIKELSLAELKEKIAEETQQLSRLVFNHSVSRLENPMQIRSTRRSIARMKTILHQREVLESTGK